MERRASGRRNPTRRATDSKVLKHTLHLDFSKRFQDLMTAMPAGDVFDDRFGRLYFDLCAEEYRL